ncbi:MAG TPA: HlyD family efflux transporter periplasmic adaptor subunit [Pseudonocardia sp.]|nr:HlyD family efflux transporter periplasmic adaptor subunit [Pseudonocardia sp.]
MAEQQGTGTATRTDGAGASANGTANGSTNGVALADPEAGGAPTKKKGRRPSKKGMIIGGVLLLLVLIAGGVAYLVNASQYVTTDNAQVDGDQIQINAPTTGTVIDWKATQGAQVRRNQAVGRIQMQGSGAQPQQVIRAPGDGTIAANPTVEGQWVTAGTNLATAYNGQSIYATARVDETDVEDVHPGALVDIDVDAYSGTPVTGVVTQIQGAAAAEFSLFPESNSSGNFQKVTQVIPVKIAFTNTGGLPLVPGMNITVHIHKHN